MKAYLFILMYFIVAGAGCAFKREDGSAKPKTAEEVARELKDQEEKQLIASKMQIGQFHIHVEPMPQANEYQLVVEWDKQNAKVEFSAELEAKRSLQGSTTQSPFYFPVKGGDQFILGIKAYTLKDVLVFDGSAKIDVPKDYIIGGSTRLSQNLSISSPRLFISRNAVITTANYQLNIFVDELVVDGATIENFSLADSAPYQTPGQNGGSVIIKAKKAIGDLVLRPRGQAGGHGLNGAVWHGLLGQHPGCAAGPGANGGAGGAILLDIGDDSQFNPLFFASPSAGGPKGIRGVDDWSPEGRPGAARQPPCDKDEPDISIDGAPGPSGSVCFISTTSKYRGCLKPTP